MSPFSDTLTVERVHALLEAAKDRLLIALERDIFRVYPTDRMFHIYHRPDGWTKAARAWWWVRAYVRGVWHALCMNSREWEDQ